MAARMIRAEVQRVISAEVKHKNGSGTASAGADGGQGQKQGQAQQLGQGQDQQQDQARQWGQGQGVPPILQPSGIHDDGGSAGGPMPASSAENGAGSSPTSSQALFQAVEINLLKLRQVILESEALAQRMEDLLSRNDP